jgi:hypothetical protein
LTPNIHNHSTQEIIKTAFEAGINMFDTAEEYADGKSEQEMFVVSSSFIGFVVCDLTVDSFHIQGTRYQGTGSAP